MLTYGLQETTFLKNRLGRSNPVRVVPDSSDSPAHRRAVHIQPSAHRTAGDRQFHSNARTIQSQGGVSVLAVAYAGPHTVVVTDSTVQVVQVCDKIDIDADGLADSLDACSAAEPGHAVDSFGCNSAQNITKILELYGNLHLEGHAIIPGDPTNGPRVNATQSGQGAAKIFGWVDGQKRAMVCWTTGSTPLPSARPPPPVSRPAAMRRRSISAGQGL